MRYLTSLMFLILLLITGGSTCMTPKDKRKDGLVRKYHANGKLLAEITYRDGKKHGPFKSWFDNGQLHEESYFENDSVVGRSISFYKNGKKTLSLIGAKAIIFMGYRSYVTKLGHWQTVGVMTTVGMMANGNGFMKVVGYNISKIIVRASSMENVLSLEKMVTR